MRSSWVRPPKTLQWNWTERVLQILNNYRTSSGRNAINAIPSMHGWKINITSWNTSNTKESSKKHDTEGPISKPRRTRRLEEKQIEPKEHNETTKNSLKKRSRQQLWPKKLTKLRKPRTSRRKKQRFQAKKHKQTSITVTKQIKSESVQLLWHGKTAKEATAKKLIAQFGFAGDPTLSTRHNTSVTLAKMPTWYYFSRPFNMAFHDFTKRHKTQKNLRSLLGLGLSNRSLPLWTLLAVLW